MKTDFNRTIKISVSRDTYPDKKTINACLDFHKDLTEYPTGEDEYGEFRYEQMAFKPWSSIMPYIIEFVLTKGYTICHFFNEFDRDKEYTHYYKNSTTKKEFPVIEKPYYDDTNMRNYDCMRMSFKRNEYFTSADMVFVDIDFTCRKTINEFLNCLKEANLEPSGWYKSPNNGVDKGNGKGASIRLRLLYVWEESITSVEEYKRISKAVNNAVVKLTTKEGDAYPTDADPQMSVASQYINGCMYKDDDHEYGSNDKVYNWDDFKAYEVKKEVETENESSKHVEALRFEENSLPEASVEPCEYDKGLLADVKGLFYADKTESALASFRLKYYERMKTKWFLNSKNYVMDIHHSDWTFGKAEVVHRPNEWMRVSTSWKFSGKKLKDGERRRKKLFELACVHRWIDREDITPDRLLVYLINDFFECVDYTDGNEITLDEVLSIINVVMHKPMDELYEICSNSHQPENIVNPLVFGKSNKMSALWSYVRNEKYSLIMSLIDEGYVYQDTLTQAYNEQTGGHRSYDKDGNVKYVPYSEETIHDWLTELGIKLPKYKGSSYELIDRYDLTNKEGLSIEGIKKLCHCGHNKAKTIFDLLSNQ